MTQGDLDQLRESCFIPSYIQIRLPEAGETRQGEYSVLYSSYILSYIPSYTRPGEVAFYEAAFHAGICLPIHSSIRMILQFYNIFPA